MSPKSQHPPRHPTHSLSPDSKGTLKETTSSSRSGEESQRGDILASSPPFRGTQASIQRERSATAPSMQQALLGGTGTPPARTSTVKANLVAAAATPPAFRPSHDGCQSSVQADETAEIDRVTNSAISTGVVPNINPPHPGTGLEANRRDIEEKLHRLQETRAALVAYRNQGRNERKRLEGAPLRNDAALIRWTDDLIRQLKEQLEYIHSRGSRKEVVLGEKR